MSAACQRMMITDNSDDVSGDALIGVFSRDICSGGGTGCEIVRQMRRSSAIARDSAGHSRFHLQDVTISTAACRRSASAVDWARTRHDARSNEHTRAHALHLHDGLAPGRFGPFEQPDIKRLLWRSWPSASPPRSVSCEKHSCARH
eukprot:6180499-Pleurochrysis_carterae.AAC.1